MKGTQWILHVSDETKGVFESIEEAKNRAHRFLKEENTIKVTSYNASAPCLSYFYDHEVQSWIKA